MNRREVARLRHAARDPCAYVPTMSPVSPVYGLLVAVALGCGCTSFLALEPRPFDTALHAGVQPGDPKDAAALVLSDDTQVLIGAGAGAAAFTEIRKYRAVRVLSEQGFSEGAAHVFFPRKGVLKDFRARTILPNGGEEIVDVASLIADDAAFGEDGVSTRSFQFPRVEIGAVLEYSYVVRVPNIWASDQQSIGGEYPILDYRLEYVFDRYTRPDLLLKNIAASFDYWKDSSTQHVVVHLKNLPARKRQPLEPPARDLHPWLIWRIIDVRAPGWTWVITSTWGDTATLEQRELVLEKKGYGEVPALTRSDACLKARACVVGAVLGHLRENATFTGFGREARAIGEVVRSRQANAAERALLAWGMLNKAGVDVRIANMARVGTGGVDETLPAGAWFNHSLLYLPARGTEPALWVDPSCDHCAVGVLPAWSRGGRAVVYEVGPSERSNKQTFHARRFADVVGNPDVMSVHRRTARVVLDEDGNATFDVTELAAGADGLAHRAEERERTSVESKRSAEASIKRDFAAARIDEAGPWLCVPAKGTCERASRFAVPGFVTLDGADFLIGSAFRWTTNDTAMEGEEERRHDVFIPINEEWRDEVRFTLPEGRRVPSLPSPLQVMDATGTMEAKAMVEDGVLVLRRIQVDRAGRHGRAAWEARKQSFAKFRAWAAQVLRATRQEPAAATPSTTTSLAPPKGIDGDANPARTRP